MEAANPDDAHRPLDKGHDLAATLSHVETRQVRPDYTLPWDGKLYEIQRPAITPGLRGATVRVEARLDGTLAVRHANRYLPIAECVRRKEGRGNRFPRSGLVQDAICGLQKYVAASG